METITKIKREQGYIYEVDKDGNVIKRGYSLFKDKLTLVMLAILILGSLYYIQTKSMKTNEANFEPACIKYIELRNKWINENPGQVPTMEQVFSYQDLQTNQVYYGKDITHNISNSIEVK